MTSSPEESETRKESEMIHPLRGTCVLDKEEMHRHVKKDVCDLWVRGSSIGRENMGLQRCRFCPPPPFCPRPQKASGGKR